MIIAEDRRQRTDVNLYSVSQKSGLGAVLSIYSEIGENTIIAEGSIVKMPQVIPGGVVAGDNPAKVIREIAPKDEEYWGMAKQLISTLPENILP